MSEIYPKVEDLYGIPGAAVDRAPNQRLTVQVIEEEHETKIRFTANGQYNPSPGRMTEDGGERFMNGTVDLPLEIAREYLSRALAALPEPKPEPLDVTVVEDLAGEEWVSIQDANDLFISVWTAFDTRREASIKGDPEYARTLRDIARVHGIRSVTDTTV